MPRKRILLINHITLNLTPNLFLALRRKSSAATRQATLSSPGVGRRAHGVSPNYFIAKEVKTRKQIFSVSKASSGARRHTKKGYGLQNIFLRSTFSLQ